MLIYPIEKANRNISTPWAVLLLIIINIAAHLLITFPAIFTNSYNEVVRSFGFIPASSKIGTAFTSLFIHSKSSWHIFGNMFFLWMFGNNVEDVIGFFLFLILYFVSGFGAISTHYLLNMGSDIPCIGASGAVSGILGAYMILFPNVKADLLLVNYKIGTTTILVGGLIWFAQQILFAIISSFTFYIPIAFGAHAGGMLSGIVIGYCLLLAGFKKRFDEKVSSENQINDMISCPCCGKNKKKPKFGKYICSDCESKFILDENGVHLIK